MARKLAILTIVPFAKEAIGSMSDDVWLVTLVDPRWLREVGDLASFDVAKAKQVLANRFGKLDVAWFVAIGGFAATVNIEEDGSCHLVWKVSLEGKIPWKLEVSVPSWNILPSDNLPTVGSCPKRNWRQTATRAVGARTLNLDHR